MLWVILRLAVIKFYFHPQYFMRWSSLLQRENWMERLLLKFYLASTAIFSARLIWLPGETAFVRIFSLYYNNMSSTKRTTVNHSNLPRNLSTWLTPLTSFDLLCDPNATNTPSVLMDTHQSRLLIFKWIICLSWHIFHLSKFLRQIFSRKRFLYDSTQEAAERAMAKTL